MAKILFEGDSITDCFRTQNLIINEFYSNEGNLGLGYPIILKGMLKVLTNVDNTYLNTAVDGSTTETILKRIDADLEFNPDYLILLIGINDYLFSMKENNKIDLAKYENNYREILNKMTAKNPNLKIILQTITYNKGKDTEKEVLTSINAMNDIIKKIAEDYNCMVIDTHALLTKKVEETKISDWYYPDGIHLTHNTYMYIADKILPYLI